ncbi:hypothetical protein EX30DRAFT_349244 [Ascodesmis nigricans]|uniref:C2H2-type domain-containing protein n=1 Tax=Ascodesmis nigricans TaxID=341454 RepID=A0A4V3SIL7_9PEZI|nr:hypothetical protein EX30DRAFT_349244 [Ascodesmis nigricans]
MRIGSQPSGAYDLNSGAQVLQHSPGSLSSCTSLNTSSPASAVHLQQIAHYQPESQGQLPIAHLGVGAPFSHQPQQQFLIPVHHLQYHQPATPPPPPPQQPQQQQTWLEVPPIPVQQFINSLFPEIVELYSPESSRSRGTQRIGGGKKGKRIHLCEYKGCNKMYSRAEHLR